MQDLKPYIAFSGNCEEAMKYYKEKLNGEIVSLMHWDQAPMDVADKHKKKVMHCEFKFDNCLFMAADAMPDKKLTMGDNISLSVGTNDLEKTERWFNSLAKDGNVTMPLQDTFWGARFGMLVDKFGIHWMFNCEQKTAPKNKTRKA